MAGQINTLLIPFLCGAALGVVVVLIRHVRLSANRRSKTKLGMEKVRSVDEPESNVEEPVADVEQSATDTKQTDVDSGVSRPVFTVTDDELMDHDSDESTQEDNDIPIRDVPPTSVLSHESMQAEDDDEVATHVVERRRLPETVKMKDKMILLAEDMGIDRDLISSFFDGSGIKFDFATDGIEACEKFEANPKAYSLILMDTQMPSMDGYDTARMIRSMDTDWAKQIPIIAMTANTHKEDIDNCFDAGMDDHITKPLDMKELQDKVFEVVAGVE
ncbi:MAG: response regulator [Chitinispirillales bacterium]|jgi:CheY-like chemotaxis protein|nr:response regulator [Chitinispirillales bacterium]